MGHLANQVSVCAGYMLITGIVRSLCVITAAVPLRHEDGTVPVVILFALVFQLCDRLTLIL